MSNNVSFPFAAKPRIGNISERHTCIIYIVFHSATDGSIDTYSKWRACTPAKNNERYHPATSALPDSLIRRSIRAGVQLRSFPACMHAGKSLVNWIFSSLTRHRAVTGVTDVHEADKNSSCEVVRAVTEIRSWWRNACDSRTCWHTSEHNPRIEQNTVFGISLAGDVKKALRVLFIAR